MSFKGILLIYSSIELHSKVVFVDAALMSGRAVIGHV